MDNSIVNVYLDFFNKFILILNELFNMDHITNYIIMGNLI